ncbi:3-hydroxyisobutyrate dehydrogenase [Pseudomonas aeruginosa]|uniref:3-hydroxyisobutyrate dehydrogenase n=1 Tax=Pseudomonas aeruginosa TaxID=287 RepID=UPI001067D838|nr:3-hydroxyisobutyrate dehydrogenase [Pseudomonas aeruginosa]TEP98311.1 3-hydroxyisobutyrate dehydrogenase [Pseudomonas aeruginosa]
MTDIAFLGLGNMGGPMAANLLKAGHRVNVFDLQPKAVLSLVEQGAQGADSALQCCEGAEVVISMLPAGQHVESLYLGDDGLLARVAGKPLLIDCSTIAPETARKVAEAAAAKGLTLLDAPVSGGVGGARAGTLSFIVGGPAEGFARARPILENMGRNIFHAGDHGAGRVAKICNNMLLGILMAGTAEALALGVKNGLDPAVLSEVMKQSSGGNWALNLYNPWPGVMPQAPASNGYAGGFQVRLMNKDLGLALANAQAVQASTPLGALARNLFSLHAQADAEHDGLDFSSIQKLYRGKD